MPNQDTQAGNPALTGAPKLTINYNKNAGKNCIHTSTHKTQSSEKSKD